MEKRDFIVGDIFSIYNEDLGKHKFVALSRTVVNKEHFTLISLSTMERWTDRVLSFDDVYSKTTLQRDEVEYLANTEVIEYVGNIDDVKNDFRKILVEMAGVEY